MMNVPGYSLPSWIEVAWLIAIPLMPTTVMAHYNGQKMQPSHMVQVFLTSPTLTRMVFLNCITKTKLEMLKLEHY